MWHGLLATNLILVVSLFLSSFANAQFAGGSFFKRRMPSLTFSTGAQTLFAGNCSGITTVSTPAVVLGAPLVVNLTSSGSVIFYSDPACTVAFTSVTIGIGLNSASFYYLENAVSNPTLTASATAYSNANQTSTIQSNPFVWTGGGGNANWNTGLNWSGGTAPGPTHTALFNSVCMSNCNPTINASISVFGIRMTSGYTGTITQTSTFTITVGSRGWVMYNGTFVGGTGAISINANAGFQFLGGTFTSTTGNFQVALESNTTSRVFIMPDSGATFNHNNGTVTLRKFTAQCFYYELFMEVPNNQNFNNFNLDAAGGGCGGTQYFNINQGKAINVLGTFTDNSSRSGINGGTIYLHGNYYSGNGTYGGGTAVLMFVGLANQTYRGGGGNVDYATTHVKINKPISGTVTPLDASTFGAQTFEIIAGSFTAPSSNFFVGMGQLTFLNLFTIPSGATFNPNGGTTTFAGTIGTCTTYTYNINVPNNFEFNNLTFTQVGGSGCGGVQEFNIMNGSTIRVLGNLNQSFGFLIGSIEFNGNYNVQGVTAGGGTAILKATGSGTQIFTSTTNYPTGGFTIQQSGAGRVVLGSNWGNSTRSWNLISGEIYMSGFNLTLQGLTLNGNTVHKKDVPGTSGSGVLTVGGSSIANGSFLGGTVAD